MKLSLLVLLAACGSKSAAPPPPVMSEAPPDAAVDAAAVDAAAVIAPTPSTRDKAEVRRAIKAKMTELQYCVEKAHLAGATVSAKLTVRFTIEEDGSVSSPSCGVAELDECCASALAKMKFVPATGVMPINISIFLDTAGS